MNADPDAGPAPSDFIRDLIRGDLASGKYGDRVQTRFPPEPNGYLHIGHAKSICLNFGIAAEFGGVCNLRFDDTNPEAEDHEYVEAILADVAWLGFTPANVFYASDYFGQIYDWAEVLVGKGLAYVDDQDGDTIRAQRGGFGKPGIESPHRNRDVEENLALLRGMRDGEFADGSRVLRAKIDMQASVMALRDPVLYRIRRVAHVRTGTDWIVYPTYDWAHGQSDAIEGVTHSICTLEFTDHRPLYDWCLDHLDLPRERPEQTEFARLGMTHTVMSKRHLRALVEDGTVDGWDDARMPTLQGMRRRGYPAAAIREFVTTLGVAKTNTTTEIEFLESFVRTHHNAHALRRMAVLEPLKLVITNWPEGQVEHVELVENPEDPTAGVRSVPFSGELWIEQDDFKLDPPPKYFRLAPGREVRLRGGYFVTATDVVTDSGGNVTEVRCTYDPATRGGSAPDGRKVKATMHWVSAAHAVDVTVHLYERLFVDPRPGSDGTEPTVNPDSRRTIVGAKAEPVLADTKPGEVVQFERLGYFATDPDTPGTFHRTVGLKDEWANIQKRNG
ncbi:glutamine--tRNA ligase/YqeY domain fusion protein [Sporichthya sp.]|uniref:glutamine--tRNA ligase/YqeY domain fusion protein n=1 Tax=Sporichthya sp. TaxID=65475 RepID=UPI0018306F63|nr:glutamine--tRNA ligase/YqeY domain fusion protein [Sporichthya sp.]MBA3742596.1 glutamine--tRNA ligase/YqeY domain fusion protein [Sporichthya sp.]